MYHERKKKIMTNRFFLNTALKERMFILCSNNQTDCIFVCIINLDDNSQLIQQFFIEFQWIFARRAISTLYFVFLDELVPSSRDRR